MVTTLKTTRSQYGSPFDNAENDYVVLLDGHVIGRIMLHPQVPEGQPWFWTITAPDTRDRSTVADIQRRAGKQ
jgi:hypothetical protein